MKEIISKYRYPTAVPIQNRQWPDRVITHAPRWVSVDMRDGNQAFPVPMNPEQKLIYFNMLLSIGFKDIEVAFPSASQDDFELVRRLITENLVPDGVRISVLTQARRHLIERTVESMAGVKNGLLHCYVPTSDLHGKFVFGREREQIRKMTVEGVRIIRDELAARGLGHVAFEFSPEEFTDSDINFVIDLCAAVKEEWGPARKDDFVLNLPATVERRPPNHYADLIEYFCGQYPYMGETTISIHSHNDQGCAVAASELAILAGATRVEGTLFGHGERTGNLDLLVLALNLHSRGIDTGLDFSQLPKIGRIVEELSGIDIHPRHPYAGSLVFTAFSGSHQDAIRKGMEQRGEITSAFEQGWKMPYLHIDPADIGRGYEDLIRVNSQSGKGGIVYLLEKTYGICPPKAMHPAIGDAVQKVLDRDGGELSAEKIHTIFRDAFVNIEGPYRMSDYTRATVVSGERLGVSLTFHVGDVAYELTGQGNGPLSAVAHTLTASGRLPAFKLEDFSQRSMGNDADAKALAFVGIRMEDDGSLIYGAGEHSNIDRAAIAALISALNRMARKREGKA